MPRNILLYLLFSLFGFFLGSIMFSLILPRHFKGVDVRQLSDDGNPSLPSLEGRAERPSRPPLVRWSLCFQRTIPLPFWQLPLCSFLWLLSSFQIA